jgi:parallel beta-helix repeat protein
VQSGVSTLVAVRDRAMTRVRLPLGVAVVLLAASACTTATETSAIPTLPPATNPPTTVAVASSTTTTGPEEPTVSVALGTDIQKLVDGSPEGTTFTLAPGVHATQQIVPKAGMTFEGRPGAVLSGAIDVTGWVLENTSVWGADGFVMTGTNRGRCQDGYDGCTFSQDLYMDDVLLWQVTSIDAVRPGTWFWRNDSIFVGDDPTSRRVELSVTPHAFRGDASNVTIRDLTIEKYATPAQLGAIQATLGDDSPLGKGWSIVRTEVRLNHGAGIRLGDETTVTDSYIHDNGQLGLVANGGSGSVVENSLIAHNNIAGFRWGWEAGGSKFKRTSNLTIRGNTVSDNNGPGLWTDIDNQGTLYDSNTVENNDGPGIFHEISFDAEIRNNIVIGNGGENGLWLWGAGILVAASSKVEVHHNTVSDNANGISGIQQDRQSSQTGKYLLEQLFVHDNTITMGQGSVGVVEDTGDRAVFTERNNRFASNTYLGPTGDQYFWDGRKLDRTGWQAAGQDVDGTWE